MVPAAAVAATALAACGSSGTSSHASGGSSAASGSSSASTTAAVSAAGLKTTTISGTKVLTNAKGFVLYSFAPDTSTTSKCNGACAKAWPPLTPSSGSTVKSPFATIKRTDGSTQLTYNGHPLYTYIGDTHPGQASGNKVTLNGGLWLDVPVAK
jgi:predicted lipoprotein with Yx(FWY)xxD motif